MPKKKVCIIISISSDIGFELAKDWINKGYIVHGTFNNDSKNCKYLRSIGCNLIKLNLSSKSSMKRGLTKLCKLKSWNYYVSAAGTQNPVGSFLDNNFHEWSKSIDINFTNQVQILHSMLKLKNKSSSKRRVLFFAGGGTNNATKNYSAYTISKIASIKLMELLQSEIKNTIFTILGPGWVKTKIHQSTLIAKNKAGKNYSTTIKKFKNNDFYPISKVISCCNWIFSAKHQLVAGRNFSSVFDPWERKEVINKVLSDDNIFKLRRFGNEIFIK